MTVKQLKEAIKDLPDNMDVFIEQNDYDHRISLANTAEVKNVKFSDRRLKAEDKCLILSDE